MHNIDKNPRDMNEASLTSQPLASTRTRDMNVIASLTRMNVRV